DDINVLAFLKNGNGYQFTELLFVGKGFKFYQFTLGRCFRFGEMPFQRSRRVLLFRFIKSELNRGITILFFRAYLRYHARASFDYGTWDILPVRIKNAGHSYFFSNNSRHVSINLLTSIEAVGLRSRHTIPSKGTAKIGNLQ